MAARTRLSVDARREQLLARGRELFAERPFDEISTDDIAVSAGVSKGLLYHYFGSKRELYVEVVRQGTAQLQAVTEIAQDVAGPERTRRALDAYLAYVEANAEGFRQLMGAGVGADPEVAAIVEDARRAFVGRVLLGIARDGVRWEGPDAPPLLRQAVRGWVGTVEGASLDWVAHRDVPRATVCAFLGHALAGVLQAALAADDRLGVTLPAALDPTEPV